jgi:SAM-dependent methyltransferase
MDDYKNKPLTYFNMARPEMLQFIPSQSRRLLEIGCGEGDFSASLKSIRKMHVTAIEPFPEAATIAKSRLDRVLTMACLKTSSGIFEPGRCPRRIIAKHAFHASFEIIGLECAMDVHRYGCYGPYASSIFHSGKHDLLV